ncbi:MAG: FHA domain-containing protein, partial [Anaerolineae bacterium]|nr:FHA domain-containing protein [Anaerolineae bacterium]
VLQEAETGFEFPLREFPAVIGRPKPGEASRLAVDLAQFKEAMTVSRPHARMHQEGQGYSIEAIKPDRPIYVNGQEYFTGQRHTLREGDVIQIGKIRLSFHMK